MIRLFLTAALSLFVPQVVLALGITDGPPPVPGLLSVPWVQGTFVYTVPESFDPQGIGQGGLSELQNVAHALHFPFYVVLAERLPDMTPEQEQEARTQGYTESGDDLRVNYAVDKLAASWIGRTGYNTSQSTIFLLSYSPRKFRMLAGPQWKNNLGLSREALSPYFNHFVQAVKGTPKDPKGGIMDTMRSFDNYVFDQVDPERIKAREEAAVQARAEEEKRKHDADLAGAKMVLASQIMAAKTMLKEDKEYLPKDTLSLQNVLKQLDATPFFDSDWQEIPPIMAASGSLSAVYAPIKDAVDRSRSAATAELIGQVMLWLFYIGIFGMIFGNLILLRRRNLARRAEFDKEYEKWMAKVRAAAGRYVDTYANRDNIIGMSDTTGKTRELWDALSAEIDEIWIGVKGIEDHLAACLKRANQARWYSTSPILDAINMLDSAFTFDTEKVNKDELFERDTKTITVVPQLFANSLEKRFKDNAAAWNRIQEASNLRMPNNNAPTLFPHDTLDRMLDEAASVGLPSDWYSDHPLAGDDASDHNVWDKADALRWSDPIAYRDAINALLAQEKVVVDRHGKLLKALLRVKNARVESIPSLNSGVDASDDPQVTLSNARDTEHRLAGLLAEKAQSRDVRAIETMAEDVVALYNKAKGQISTIEAALKDATAAVNQALDESDTKDLDKQAGDRIRDARAVHANVTVAEQDYASGQTLAAQAHGLGLDAKKALKNGRHLEALRAAQKATALFGNAAKAFNKALAYCQCLDRNKAEFEQKLARMGDLRDDYVDRVRRYKGPVAKLPAYRSPQELNVMDYAASLSHLTAQEAQWERVARESQRAYEGAQAAERAERERQERHEREVAQAAAEESRRQSYSSYSSPSYSSPSYSDSGGGSYDSGGGSSAGGGDW